MSIVVAGFLLGISLIVAMGPQNILLIKQGIRREAVTAVVLVCLISDIFLYIGGVLGVGALTDTLPQALTVLRWVGVAYLSWFAYTSFRDALRPPRDNVTVISDEAPRIDAPSPTDSWPESSTGGTDSTGGTALKTRTRRRLHMPTPQRAWVKPAITAVILTWLNPGAYLDSLVMIGGIANQYGDAGRWAFVAGTYMASIVWFCGVGYGAGLLHRPLSSPRVWRVLNVVFGVILVSLAAKLILL
ncbi:LysE/ArgO family amino acid transporter [Corynebacterium uberis]|uniref:LysE/ArgO family amino acid transporter n=1 Tax=Corynebacterium TaxID=1716 RepID=UPI001D0A7718|nr:MULTISPECIES: LysE/ArgO family amino acid transporter [Corynebacterium]MCZ9309096.1 LysE/ArgO family amino acid transporter [Corynebacterium sp. c6VSa_13]UDL74438.1 LysE/ArgO family amino acid transporter [Corynebacterium uberis]UDL76727.1 LysE/ArgO family amino acid transporter [Corynebacterium uberis]UDL78940.1 LysE/ArgO family amino acid transporter [Corynebacterium uberis]UDL81218.1 LysE/ArgO family amino acid transporter [Corynebacterium uberis]